MCSNDAASSLNALMSAGANAIGTVTVHYGPYMNWGRWNHNTRRIQALLAALKKANISVQLAHDDKETTWQDHGRVRVVLADGTVLADEPDAQHNRNYSAIPATMEKLAALAERALKAGMGQPKAGGGAAAAPAADAPKAADATKAVDAPKKGGISLATDLATAKVTTTDVAAAAN